MRQHQSSDASLPVTDCAKHNYHTQTVVTQIAHYMLVTTNILNTKLELVSTDTEIVQTSLCPYERIPSGTLCTTCTTKPLPGVTPRG